MKKLTAELLIRVSILVAFGLGVIQAIAADIPAKPAQYFNDYASLVDSQTAQQLEQKLQDFERQTSNQILVVIYPSLPEDASIEDFTQDAFRSWKPGQAGRNNGAILFVFVKDRKMRIQTGYGLEGALPDAICKRIISDQMAPRFQAGDFGGGLVDEGGAVDFSDGAHRHFVEHDNFVGRFVADAGAREGDQFWNRRARDFGAERDVGADVLTVHEIVDANHRSALEARMLE